MTNGIRCVCGGDTTVLDSRGLQGHAAIRRRRACLVCGAQVTTYEVVAETDLSWLVTATVTARWTWHRAQAAPDPSPTSTSADTAPPLG